MGGTEQRRGAGVRLRVPVAMPLAVGVAMPAGRIVAGGMLVRVLAGVTVRVDVDGAVGMPVLVGVSVFRVLVRVFAGVAVRVDVHGAVGMPVLVDVAVFRMRVDVVAVMLVGVRVGRPVRVRVLVLVLVAGDRNAVDPGLAGTATAGGAHRRSPRRAARNAATPVVHSIAISRTRMSPPATTWSW
jgi:hypothetical protein